MPALDPDNSAATKSTTRVNDLAVLGCFILTGALALIYEICWIRKATLVFGAASFALSTVLAVFFAGLAIGSYLFGKRTDRVTKPLRVYAILEIGITLLVLLSPTLFVSTDALYSRFYPQIYQNFALLSLIRFVLVTVVLLPPTILMGATLPLLCRHFVRHESSIARSVGFVYGLNTLGAAIGSALCGLLFIRYIGINRTIYIAGAVNFILASVIWQLSKTAAPPPVLQQENSLKSDAVSMRHTSIMPGLFFISGFVALGHEVLWTRFLSLLMRNTVYTYTLTLTVILVGIVLGSMLAARLFDRLKQRALMFGMIQVGIGLTVMTVLLLPAAWWQQWRDTSHPGTQLALIALVLLPPAILSGISFPLAIRMVVARPTRAGYGVGMMTALNTAGGIAGALIIGFGVLPLLGMHYTLLITTGLSIASGVAAWCVLERTASTRLRTGLIVISLILWLTIPKITATRLPADFLAGKGQLIDYREGLSSFMAVLNRRSINQLEIDRMWQGEDKKNHQIMAAHIPMLHHPQPQDVLVIGIGAGQTAGRFLMHRSLRSLDCVDIESKLIPLIKKHFDSSWLDDNRVSIIVEDGRNFLTHTDRKYDLISIEVGQAFRPTVASFYTADFYQRASLRLKPGGLISQFVPISFFTVEHFRVVINTFLDTFPNSVLWYNSSELLLIGSVTGDVKITRQRLAELEDDAVLTRDLKYSYWGGPGSYLNKPMVMLGGFLAGPEGLMSMSRSAAIYRDDLPYLEYETSTKSARQEQQIVELIRSGLDPQHVVLDASPAPSAEDTINTIRKINLDDILASEQGSIARVQMNKGNMAKGISSLRSAISLNPENLLLRNAYGMALRDSGQLEQAAQQFRFVLKRDPNHAYGHNNLGITLVSLDKMEDALHHFREAVRCNPQLFTGQVNLGQALLVTDQPAASVKHFRKAISINPNDAAVFNNLGRALAQQDQINQAIVHFRKAVQLEPDNSSYRNDLQLAQEVEKGNIIPRP